MGKLLKLLLIPAGIAFYVRLVTKYVFDFIRGFNVHNKRFETDTPIVMEFAFPAARGKLHAN
jgi:hypothetical protein